jgi:hypothetical protein
MDVSKEPFVELVTAGPDELGLWCFEKKPIAGTLLIPNRASHLASLR